MANADRPRGFRPHERAKRVTPYVAGSAIYPGDAVKMSSDGKVDSASASEALLGVAATYASADGQEVLVWDDPDQKFVVQADDGTAIAQADVGLNYDIVATAGNSTYNQSRQELDANSGMTTPSTLPLRLCGISREVGNVAGEFAECVVSINEHQLRPGTAGV